MSVKLTFHKYPSIENSCRKRFIHKAITLYPELKDIEYVITEKIHGTNFAVYISKDEVKFAKRTAFLQPDENFYNYQQVVKNNACINKLIDTLQPLLTSKVGYIFYGELFGKGIQREIDYGDDQYWRVFDIYIIREPFDRFLSFKEMVEFMTSLSLSDCVVPILDIVTSLDAALNYPEKFITKLNPKPDNYAEGIVIKPYRKVYRVAHGKPFVLKKKAEWFEEVKPAAKPKHSDKLVDLIEDAKRYVTKARLHNVFSKWGVIENESQIEKYIGLMREDIRKDMMADNSEFAALQKKIQDKVLKAVTRDIVKLLQAEL